ARLQVTGAVGTTIPYLGALSGQINLTLFLGPHPGAVGRIFLTLQSNQIPGVQLQGDFLLELNTFATAQQIQTFKVNQDANGMFGGFAHDARGNLVVTTTTIGAGPGFNLTSPCHIAIRIDSSDLVARVALSLTNNFDKNVGLNFNASTTLSLNTTNTTQTLNGSSVPNGFDVLIQGSVTFAGFATTSGSVDLTLSNNAF